MNNERTEEFEGNIGRDTCFFWQARVGGFGEMFWPLLVLSLSWGVVQCCLWYSSLLVFVSRELKDAWGNMDLLQVTFYQRCPQGLLTDVWLFFLFCIWSLYPPLQLLLFWDVQQGEIKGREKVMSHLAKFSHGWVIFVTAGKGKTIWPRVFAFDPVTGFSDLWDVLVTLPSWSVGGHCPGRFSPFSYPCRGWNRIKWTCSLLSFYEYFFML